MRALVKLEQVLPAHLRRRVSALGSATFTLPVAGPTVDPQHLTVIATACRDAECLRFAYRSRDGTDSRREVEPHSLVNHGPPLVSGRLGSPPRRLAHLSRRPPGRPVVDRRRASRRARCPRRTPPPMSSRASPARRTATRRGSPFTPPRRRSRTAPGPLGDVRADRRAHLRVQDGRRRPRMAGDADRDAGRRLRGPRAAGADRASAGAGHAAQPRRSLRRQGSEYLVNCGSVSRLTGHTTPRGCRRRSGERFWDRA